MLTCVESGVDARKVRLFGPPLSCQLILMDRPSSRSRRWHASGGMAMASLVKQVGVMSAQRLLRKSLVGTRAVSAGHGCVGPFQMSGIYDQEVIYAPRTDCPHESLCVGNRVCEISGSKRSKECSRVDGG